MLRIMYFLLLSILVLESKNISVLEIYTVYSVLIDNLRDVTYFTQCHSKKWLSMGEIY